jgi:hypothetical protein
MLAQGSAALPPPCVAYATQAPSLEPKKFHLKTPSPEPREIHVLLLIATDKQVEASRSL